MANSFAILRTQKLTTTSKLKAAGQHNARQVAVPNADPNGKVYRLMGSDDPFQVYQDKITQLGITERKNGVPAFEVVVSYSPEHQVPLKAWAKAQMAFFEEQYGKDRILSMHLHMDETTPHAHVIVMPLVQKQGKWKLACRDFLGGSDKLIKLQDDYAKAMEPFGLERGIKNSKATHQKIRKYYGEMQKDINEVVKQLDQLEKPGLFNFKDVIKKTKLMLQTALLQAAKIGRLETVNAKLKDTILTLQNFKSDVLKSAKGLSLDEIKTALSRASELKEDQKRVIRERAAHEYEVVPVSPVAANMGVAGHISIKPQEPAKPSRSRGQSKSDLDMR